MVSGRTLSKPVSAPLPDSNSTPENCSQGMAFHASAALDASATTPITPRAFNILAAAWTPPHAPTTTSSKP
jgi:hypothetical protein